MPICLPVSSSNESREQETRQRGQVEGRSAAPLFDVCESAHQCVEQASSWHGGSLLPHPEQRTADCLAVGASGLVVFQGERTDLFQQAALQFFLLMGPQLQHLASNPPYPTPPLAQANGLMIRILLLSVLSSPYYYNSISHMLYSATPISFLMG